MTLGGQPGRAQPGKALGKALLQATLALACKLTHGARTQLLPFLVWRRSAVTVQLLMAYDFMGSHELGGKSPCLKHLSDMNHDCCSAKGI